MHTLPGLWKSSGENPSHQEEEKKKKKEEEEEEEEGRRKEEEEEEEDSEDSDNPEAEIWYYKGKQVTVKTIAQKQ